MTRMTPAEKEQFLAGLHVGIVAIPEAGRGPLCVPVWYDYRPGGDLWFVTGPTSRKGRLLRQGLRISLCAQTEDLPYRYVSVEGPIVALDAERDESLPMAVRYLGEQMGAEYARTSAGEDSIVVRLRPERWLAVDYGKQGD